MEQQPWREALSNPDDCARYEAYLTALFDGEARPEEAQIARAHLAACDDCSFLWKQWDQARFLLSTTPPAPVPPTLLLRILMACRLLALPRRRRVHDATPVRLPAARPMPILPAYSDDMTPRPSREVPVPPDLMANILSRTTGASNSATAATVESPWAAPQNQPQPSRLRGLAPYQRVHRFATAIAVPALAAWFLIAVHHSPRQPMSAVRTASGQASGAPAILSTTTAPLAGPGHIIQGAVEHALAASKPNETETPSATRDTSAVDRSAAGNVPTVQTASLREPVSPMVARAVLLPAIDSGSHVALASTAGAPLMSWQPDKVHLATDSIGAAATHADQPDTTPVAVPERPAPVEDDQNDVTSVGDMRPASIGHVVDDFRASLIDDAHDDADDQTAG